MPIGKALLSNEFKLELNGVEVPDIREFPDLMTTPEALDTTTLGDTQLTSRPGLKGTDALEFTLLFSGMDGNWAMLRAIELADTPAQFMVTLSSGDMIRFRAYVSLGIPGRGANEVMEFTATLTPSTAMLTIAKFPPVLTFVCVEDTPGNVKVESVSPVLTEGNSYQVVVTDADFIIYEPAGKVISEDAYTLGDPIAATASDFVVIYEVDDENKVVKAGSASADV